MLPIQDVRTKMTLHGGVSN